MMMSSPGVPTIVAANPKQVIAACAGAAEAIAPPSSKPAAQTALAARIVACFMAFPFRLDDAQHRPYVTGSGGDIVKDAVEPV
jgi:hypothetical protein